MGPRFESAFSRGLQKAVLMVERRAKEKLSGEVLNVRSGLLRASIRGRVEGGVQALETLKAKYPQVQTALFQTSGGSFLDRGMVGFVGSDVVYSRIHELGGVAGRGHAAHIPARPYLATSVAELSQEIIQVIEKEVVAEIRR